MDHNEKETIKEHIKNVALSTDSLISRLDTLTNRIDTARMNENDELVQFYENEFTELSVEFMDGVETILDEWYALRGIERPPVDNEALDADMLEEIHNTVVRIVAGLPDEPSSVPLTRFEVKSEETPLLDENIVVPEVQVKKKKGRGVDFTG